MRALIVHSPLVGPSTVTPLAAELAALGLPAEAPDLRAAVSSSVRYRQEATLAAMGFDVAIGHSGAGAFLPVIAQDAGVGIMVFVDAVVPGEDAGWSPSRQLVELLDAVPQADGLLAPWSEWWPPGTMARLVPDEVTRRQIESELPRIPRSFYEPVVPLPPRWWLRPARYLQLSAAYDEDAARAAGWGWPSVGLQGQHLDLCTRPAVVATAVRDLLGRV